MKSFFWTIGMACSMTLLAGCATQPAAPKTIAETIAATPQLSTLSQLVNEAGLGSTLQTAGPFTVFAPTNDAFKSVPAKTLEALGKDKALLASVLSFHVVPAKVAVADVKNGPVKTVQGSNIALSKSGNFVTVEDAVATSADMMATNGVVHVIDRVLIPPPPGR